MKKASSASVLNCLALGLWSSLTILAISNAHAGWGKIVDDRITMMEDVETIFTGWNLEQDMRMTHNGGTLCWLILSAPKERPYYIADLTAQVKKFFVFDGSPWMAIRAKDIPYAYEIKRADSLLCYVWKMTVTSNGETVERSVYVLMNFEAKKSEVHLQVMQMHR